MAHGGKRRGAGRKPGSITRRTREIAESAAAKGLGPLDYLLSIMRDETAEQRDRIKAASEVLPYMAARISATEQKPGNDYVPLAERLKAYARRDAIEQSEGKVVEIKRRD